MVVPKGGRTEAIRSLHKLRAHLHLRYRYQLTLCNGKTLHALQCSRRLHVLQVRHTVHPLHALLQLLHLLLHELLLHVLLHLLLHNWHRICRWRLLLCRLPRWDHTGVYREVYVVDIVWNVHDRGGMRVHRMLSHRIVVARTWELLTRRQLSDRRERLRRSRRTACNSSNSIRP